MVTFGGEETSSNIVDDLWAFNFTSNEWTEITQTATRPSARSFFTMELALSSLTACQGVLFGGQFRTALDSAVTQYDDVWALDLTLDMVRGNADALWTEVTILSSGPEVRFDHAMATRSSSELYVYGGVSALSGEGGRPSSRRALTGRF